MLRGTMNDYADGLFFNKPSVFVEKRYFTSTIPILSIYINREKIIDDNPNIAVDSEFVLSHPSYSSKKSLLDEEKKYCIFCN